MLWRRHSWNMYNKNTNVGKDNLLILAYILLNQTFVTYKTYYEMPPAGPAWPSKASCFLFTAGRCILITIPIMFLQIWTKNGILGAYTIFNDDWKSPRKLWFVFTLLMHTYILWPFKAFRHLLKPPEPVIKNMGQQISGTYSSKC